MKYNPIFLHIFLNKTRVRESGERKQQQQQNAKQALNHHHHQNGFTKKTYHTSFGCDSGTTTKKQDN